MFKQRNAGIPSLKKLATSAFIVQLRNIILSQRSRIWTKKLNLLSRTHEKIYKKNVIELKKILADAKTITENLSNWLHDSPRWIALINDLVDALEETVYAVDSSYGSHMTDFHVYENCCLCWDKIDTMILNKARSLRERLFGPL